MVVDCIELGGNDFYVRKCKTNKRGKRSFVLEGHSVMVGEVELRLTQASAGAPVQIRAYEDAPNGDWDPESVALTDDEVEAGIGELCFSKTSSLVRVGLGDLFSKEEDLQALKDEYRRRFGLRSVEFIPASLPSPRDEDDDLD